MDAAAPKPALSPIARPAPDPREARLRAVARDFEATFIAQMLNYAGFGKSVSSDAGFGGEAFSSLLVDQYARQIADRGGFGLAESIYRQLKLREGAHDARA